MKRAIVIGASSGIGKEVARELSEEGYILGLAARRTELLEGLKNELNHPAYIQRVDVGQSETATQLRSLINKLGGLDLIIISSGVGFINTELEWEKEKQTIEVNALGFAAVANVAFNYFAKQGSGCIAAISSIAAIRGSAESPSYSASKSFVSNYMEGLRCKAKKLKSSIQVIDIQPGFVNTAMAQGEGLFWVADTQKAARQIVKAIHQSKNKVYVTKRWRIIAYILRVMPDWLYYKLNV